MRVHVDERRDSARSLCGRAADGVVARQAHQLTVAEQIRAGVADVGEKQVAAGPERRSHRRLQAGNRPGEGVVDDGAVDVPIEHLRASHDLFRDGMVDSQIPFREVADQVHQRGDGEMAGRLARSGGTQAVRHDHRVARTLRSALAIASSGRLVSSVS